LTGGSFFLSCVFTFQFCLITFTERFSKFCQIGAFSPGKARNFTLDTTLRGMIHRVRIHEFIPKGILQFLIAYYTVVGFIIN